jgi:hypothetical protein
MKRLILVCLFVILPLSAQAFVSGAVTPSPGEWDAQLRFSRETGLLGSQNIPESQIREKADITEYGYRLGTNLGERFGMSDFSVHAFGSFFVNGEELLNGSRTYPRDSGHLLGLEVSSNFVHEPSRQLGWFVRYSAPVSLATEKFGKSRIDTVGVGLQSGFLLTDTVQIESLTFYGSGYSRNSVREQNASLVFSGLFGVRIPNSVFQGTVLKVGPFFESDLTERNDSVYGLTGFRGYRVGLTGIAALKLTSDLGLELGYIQKLSGAYFRATKDLYASIGMTF